MHIFRALSIACAAASVFVADIPHAQARDWFVRQDSGGGDGSLQKPFADPWMALDKCEAGDAIHVAAGKYYGRAKVGTWEIPFVAAPAHRNINGGGMQAYLD